jgi:cell division septation protein DedD
MLLSLCFFLGGTFMGIWLERRPSISSQDLHQLKKAYKQNRKNLQTLVSKNLQKKITNIHSLSHKSSASTSPQTNSQNTSLPSSQMPDSPQKAENQRANYAIQLGTFISSTNANDLRENLQKKHIRVRVLEQKDPEKGVTFVVRSGNFNTFDEALAFTRSLDAEQQLSAIVVPIDVKESAE